MLSALRTGPVTTANAAPPPTTASTSMHSSQRRRVSVLTLARSWNIVMKPKKIVAAMTR